MRMIFLLQTHHHISHTEGNQDLLFSGKLSQKNNNKINKGQKELLQCHERPAKCTEVLLKHSCNIPSLPHHPEGYKRIFNKATEHKGLYIFDVPQLEGKTTVY